jgi:hypothetical protein
MSPSSIAGRSSAASQSAAAAAAISPASRACQCGTGLGECSNPLGDEWGNNVSNGGVWKEGAVRRRGECSGAGGAGAEIREGKGREGRPRARAATTRAARSRGQLAGFSGRGREADVRARSAWRALACWRFA